MTITTTRPHLLFISNSNASFLLITVLRVPITRLVPIKNNWSFTPHPSFRCNYLPVVKKRSNGWEKSKRKSLSYWQWSIRTRRKLRWNHRTVNNSKYLCKKSGTLSICASRSDKKILHQMSDLMKRKHQLRLMELEESVLLAQVRNACRCQCSVSEWSVDFGW